MSYEHDMQMLKGAFHPAATSNTEKSGVALALIDDMIRLVELARRVVNKPDDEDRQDSLEAFLDSLESKKY